MKSLYSSLLATSLFLLCSPSLSFSQGTIKQLLNNGPTDKRVNIVFLSEAYPASQLPKYLDDANRMLNVLLDTEPYREYKSYFNAFAISIASVDSGSDHPFRGVSSNTYFNSSFDTYNTQRLVTIPPNDLNGNYPDGRGKVDALLQKLMPEYDIVLMIVNDDEYGGSGGGVAVVSTNSASGEIAVHELGHSFAHLGDEYSTPYPGYPDVEEPNTTRETRRDFIKWRLWTLDATPIPTPYDDPAYSNAVGLFEGAHYHDTGWYRPQLNCKMLSLGVEFCSVCAEALVKSSYALVHPIDSAFPSAPTLTLSGSQSEVLGVTPLVPTTHSLSIQWTVDDVPVSGATQTSFTAVAGMLGNGTHTIRVDVVDSSAFVRNDPTQLLRESREWTVMVSGVSSVDDSDGDMSSAVSVHTSPNPFDAATTISFSLAKAANVKLTILSPRGESLATLVTGRLAPGAHTARWEASGMAQGVYYYRLNAGDKVLTGKLLLVR